VLLSQQEFGRLNVLLLESSGPMRSAIFYMLQDLGVQKLTVESLSRRVLELLDEQSFDIVLLGHNGRDATTGVQLLEEARYRGYMRPTSGWILMTSDSSQELILHAIDSRPDEVIAKPFSRSELGERLSALVRRKRALRPVDEALEREDYRAVVAACRKIPRFDSVYPEASLIRARALMQLGEVPAAVQLLESLYWEAPDKELGAALAQAYTSAHRLDEAEKILAELLENYPLFMQAYDLLAKVQELQGEIDEARETLLQATAHAPLGVPRQMELGRVATQSKALDVARSAYKRTISLSKHSCYRSPDPHLRLANIARLQLQSIPERAQFAVAREIKEILQQAQREFPADQTLKVKSELVLNEAYLAMGDLDAASKALSRADTINSGLAKPLNLNLEKDLLNNEPVPVLQPLRVSEPAVAVEETKRDPQKSTKVNRIGIKHYLAGKLSQAIRYFGMATEYDPNNSMAYLNLAQLFLESARDDSKRRDERLRMVDRYLRLTQRMELGVEERQRQEKLKFLRETPISKLPKGSLAVLLQ